MFHEADGRGEIVEEPGETTVIEIDDAEPLSVHEKVCKAQVGMNKAKAMALATIGIEPLRECIGNPLQELPRSDPR